MKPSVRISLRGAVPRFYQQNRQNFRIHSTRASSTGVNQTKGQLRSQQDGDIDFEEADSSKAGSDPFQIDYSSKTVTTASGTLPLSPIMDPSFHEIRGQYTTKPKERASRSSRKEPELDLSRNIYARALATPPRACVTTRTVLPNFFLTKFKTVKDPEQDKNWFVPTEVSLTSDGLRVQDEMPGPGSLALCRQELFREFSVAGSKYHGADKTFGKLRQTRRQTTGGKNPLWREDMDSYILTLLRGHITQCLVRFAGMVETAGRKHIIKSDSWEDIKQRTSIGCVLYLNPTLDQAEQDTHESASRPLAPPPGRLSIMDLKDDKMETKVPIHDLQVLLGQENVARLRDRKALFRDGAIFVLAGKRTEDLQMQLWRLQGYMATQELDNPKKLETSQQALP